MNLCQTPPPIIIICQWGPWAAEVLGAVSKLIFNTYFQWTLGEGALRRADVSHLELEKIYLTTQANYV